MLKGHPLPQVYFLIKNTLPHVCKVSLCFTCLPGATFWREVQTQEREMGREKVKSSVKKQENKRSCSLRNFRRF